MIDWQTLIVQCLDIDMNDMTFDLIRVIAIGVGLLTYTEVALGDRLTMLLEPNQDLFISRPRILLVVSQTTTARLDSFKFAT